jgi:hypothetical protein
MDTATNTRGRGAARWLLAGLGLATCARVWLGPADWLPRAEAQIPDSGLQRKEMIDELARTNQLLEEVLHVLKSGTVKVSLASTDKPKSGVTPPKPQGP